MAAIIKSKNFKAFERYNTIEEVEAAIKIYIESYLGHVVESYEEANKWLDEIFGEDRQYTHDGDRQYAHITLNNDTYVRIVITEVVSDSGADTEDYCYMVSVKEE